jgi:nitrite reductase/ring-hydroxylating ferredoxin subunit
VGAIRRIDLTNRPSIAVYNVAGTLYATDDTCTHGDASLADGEIDGEEIICPYHAGAFNIRSGLATSGPCEAPLTTYAVTLEAGVYYLHLASNDEAP